MFSYKIGVIMIVDCLGIKSMKDGNTLRLKGREPRVFSCDKMYLLQQLHNL